MRRQTGVPRETIIDTMAQEFITRYGATPASLTDTDMKEAEEMVTTKFGNDAWTKRIP